MALLVGSVQLGFLYAVLALGVFISFRILNIPDLTADGSFTLGLSVSAVFAMNGHALLGILVAVATGAAAGAITGFLQTKAGIHPVLAGILTMFGLQSINLFVMGSPNISLIGKDTVFTLLQRVFSFLSGSAVRTLLPAVVCVAVVLALGWFFSTQLGLSIRATGSNEDMVRASSINVDGVKIIGFALSNALVAFSGGMMAQYQGYADSRGGVGIVTIGLASVIIGEVLFGKRGLLLGLASAAVGAVLYRLMLAFALKLQILPTESFNLISAVIIGLALAVPAIKKRIQFVNAKKGGGRRA
ncbi:MAG: ABC transporter permease [Oscillospiraceae bacterium]